MNKSYTCEGDQIIEKKDGMHLDGCKLISRRPECEKIDNQRPGKGQ